MSDLSSLSLSSSNEDEPVPNKRRIFRDRINPFDFCSDEEFKNHYRVSKPVVLELINLIPNLEPPTLRNQSISALEQILLTMNFYATGAFQITVADHIRIHKSTACRIIKKVSAAIAHLCPHIIKIPKTPAQRNTVKNGFYAIHSFPNVVGALGCTHIKIQSPGGPTAELFRNRDGHFSFNVQAVCDSELRIMDIIARWPGSTHDTTIFNDSHLRAEFEVGGRYENDFLLGDSGYPCRNYLLTPFRQPSTSSEEAYNIAHIATRNPIERCFGALKKRFPCLSMGLRVKQNTAMNIIVACAVLHNLAINNNDILDGPLPDDNASKPDISSQTIDENTSVRSSLLLTHFNR